MGLMCSLRGHDWSERELEDERDERGNEVVLTVREYEVCSRCDARNLVSENTEVTSVGNGGDTDADAVVDEGDGEAVDEGDGEAVDAGAEPDAPAEGATVDAEDDDGAAADEDAAVEGEDAAIIVDAEDDGDAADGDVATADAPADDVVDDAGTPAAEDDTPAVEGEDATVVTESPSDGDATAGSPETVDAAAAPEPTADPHEDPATDDGVILPGDEEPSTDDERGHGEWPERDAAEADESAEPAAWPDHEGEDDGYDAELPDGEAADVEFGGGLSPAAAEDDAEPQEGRDAEFVDDATGRAPEHARDSAREERSRPTDGESVTGIASASEVTAPSEGTSTSPDAQLVCPACGNAESRSRTSLRAGDICPECKRGYLAEADE